LKAAVGRGTLTGRRSFGYVMPTPARVEVPALCAFEHEGRSYVRGEMVTCSPVVAVVLARRGKVSLSRHDQVQAPTYHRRDMRAHR
jgi:hypothetical protein